MSRAEDSRFDSWKKIASYLGRDVRTVRRWERTRGLPVHRVPGGGRRAVYAFRNEIDTWLSDKMEQSPIIDVLSQEDRTGSLAQSILSAKACLQSGTESKTVGDVILPGASENKSPSQSLTLTSRLRSGTVAGAILVVVAVLTVFLVWVHRSESARTDPEGPPEISAVSSILPQRDQTIVIQGRGFGLHTPYRNTDVPFLAIRNMTAKWAAGRIIPQNWDEVMLSVKSWEDTQIVISGFSGAYGSGKWKLTRGDEIEIAVWNPQSGHGPAIYHIAVSASSTD